MSFDSDPDHEDRELTEFERRTQLIFYAPKFSPNDESISSWCHFVPINPHGIPFKIVDTTTPIAPPTPEPLSIPRSPRWYRSAILGAAECLVAGLPKSKRLVKKIKAPVEANACRKRQRGSVTFSTIADSKDDALAQVPKDIPRPNPTINTPTKRRKNSLDVSKDRKRPKFNTLFTIAEDSDAEKIARVPRSAINTAMLETEGLITAKATNKLNAFNYKAISIAERSLDHIKLSTKFETLQIMHDLTSTPDELKQPRLAGALYLHIPSHSIKGSGQDPRDGHIAEKKLADLKELTERARRRQKSPIIISSSDAAHPDGYIIEKNHQQLRKLAQKPLRNRKISRIAFPSKMADVAHTPPLALSTDLSEDAFEEDDSIFDELIANGEVEIRPMMGTPTTNEVYSDLLSTLTPLPSFTASPVIEFSPTGTATNNHYHQATPFNPPTPPLKPTLRSVLPTPVPTLSPIPNLTPKTRVITCFRVAEALRLLSPTTNTPFRAIELYAVVLSSSRSNQDKTQTFQFADLYFPRRPPYLHGIFRAYSGSEYFEEDSFAFLSTPADSSVGERKRSKVQLCRAIIRAAQTSTTSLPSAGRRSSRGGESGSSQNSTDGTQRMREENRSGRAVTVEILSIWKADWDDVQYVRGIVLEDDI